MGPSSSHFLVALPSSLNSVEEVMKVVHTAETAKTCGGSADADFVALCERRGGVIKSTAGNIVAYVDTAVEPHTVRHTNCHIRSSSEVCDVCCRYRGPLRALRSKAKGTEANLSQRTAHDSHTKISRLKNTEVVERLQNVQRAKRTLTKSNQRLRERLQKLIEKEGVLLHEDDERDIEALFTEASKKVDSRNNFQKFFWEQQCRYNKLKSKRSMRWHPLMVRFALNLKYLSSAAYRAVGQFLALPSERTLRHYTHFEKFSSGT
jgi:hypothetical protein